MTERFLNCLHSNHIKNPLNTGAWHQLRLTGPKVKLLPLAGCLCLVLLKVPRTGATDTDCLQFWGDWEVYGQMPADLVSDGVHSASQMISSVSWVGRSTILASVAPIHHHDPIQEGGASLAKRPHLLTPSHSAHSTQLTSSLLIVSPSSSQCPCSQRYSYHIHTWTHSFMYRIRAYEFLPDILLKFLPPPTPQSSEIPLTLLGSAGVVSSESLPHGLSSGLDTAVLSCS